MITTTRKPRWARQQHAHQNLVSCGLCPALISQRATAAIPYGEPLTLPPSNIFARFGRQGGGDTTVHEWVLQKI
ncbi:unnamed protein product [Chondrus crispus]|uniref:Uncharacterized protein n=1 Tax=Chondrus crispus TaxID=2769 RepID=R7QUQ7_CHOCR|nr:unnamed protein product [Chondrus crispus]CDF41216.1 unnamed protein product [Chondrus crispus]|eukprot:XP_005711510.1 unnamed protein product [Chondrus crispus]